MRKVRSGYRYYSPELGRWPSRDPIGEIGFLEGVIRPTGILEGESPWSDVGITEASGGSFSDLSAAFLGAVEQGPQVGLYVFAGNEPVGVVDIVGLYTLKQCFNSYTKSLKKKAKKELWDCLKKCVTKGDKFKIAKCLAGCGLKGNVVRAARIGCCVLGVGTESTINPCASSVPHGPGENFCFDCEELKICTQTLLGTIKSETAIKTALLKAECYCGTAIE